MESSIVGSVKRHALFRKWRNIIFTFTQRPVTTKYHQKFSNLVTYNNIFTSTTIVLFSTQYARAQQ